FHLKTSRAQNDQDTSVYALRKTNYAGCNLDRKSTLGGCQILGGKLVCWRAKKQSSVALSLGEAEYVAAVGCCTQVLWIKSQLADYDVLYDKETVKASLATLGLIDENDTSLQSSDLIKSSLGSHDQLNANQQTIIFLSMIMEHLLGEAYINENLKTLKPHHIIASTFKPTLENEVLLMAHMCTVANLSPEPIKSLIPPSGEVNADDSADKSSSETSMQPVTQPKAPTDLKPKKKRISPSSKPKTLNPVRDVPQKKQVTKTRLAKETVATAGVTQSLVASELAEEKGNQPNIVDAKKIIIF
ncbi:hypothetical protein Tco_1192323, partial [Tanacetum coccineum]